MKTGDFLLCTFEGDTANPPVQYVAEISSVDTVSRIISCALVDTDQLFTFNYLDNASGPWQGSDSAGTFYQLSTHDIYSAAAIDPYAQGVAVVTFGDARKYLGHVNAVTPQLDITFYHYGNPRITLTGNSITSSNWEAYAQNASIMNVEGFEYEAPAAAAGAGTASAGSVTSITQLAAGATIANYAWKNRGKAPAGYIKGMALTFARVYCKWKAGDAAAIEMAKANTGDDDHDGLAWYAQIFADAGMDNSASGVDTLRHLFVLLIGLGMRESSGRYCEGRDKGASNTTADTAEAGLFQTSFNARSSHTTLPAMFTSYANRTDFVDVFSEGVTCSASNLENFGAGDGKEYQRLAKACPPFAVEFTAVALRNRRKHWGPINERFAEVRPEADAMLLQVQQEVDRANLCPLVM